VGTRDYSDRVRMELPVLRKVDLRSVLEPSVLKPVQGPQEGGNSLGAGLSKGIATNPSTEPVVSSVRVRSYDRATHKKCIRCREVLLRDRFGDHNSVDGKQSICFDCKNKRGKERREQNVRARLRHHISTRVISQLGAHCPEGVTRDLEHYLGYSFAELVRALSARLKQDYPDKKLVHVLQDGWHVDHLYPLSRYKVVVGDQVDWEEFKRCWHPSNLAAIPAEDNLRKGAKVVDLSKYTTDEESPI
jgi:hypothetical protein